MEVATFTNLEIEEGKFKRNLMIPLVGKILKVWVDFENTKGNDSLIMTSKEGERIITINSSDSKIAHYPRSNVGAGKYVESNLINERSIEDYFYVDGFRLDLERDSNQEAKIIIREIRIFYDGSTDAQGQL